MPSLLHLASWEKVEHEKARLQTAISELGTKVSEVLIKQENEFLTAFKSHMRNVSRDFHTLKNEVDEKEAAIENNTLVKQLEEEKKWYKKEALHLDSVLTKTKKREALLSEKVEELEQDRAWLSNQLKDMMKEKKSLERRLNGEETIDLDGLEVTPVTEE